MLVGLRAVLAIGLGAALVVLSCGSRTGLATPGTGSGEAGAPSDAGRPRPDGCTATCGGTCSHGNCLITLASGQTEPWSLAVDDASVYWASAGSGDGGLISSVPRGGGAITTLATGQSPCGIAVDATSVYWTNCSGGGYPGEVMRVPLAGGAVTTLASSQDGPYAIAADGAGSIYWVNGDVPRPGDPTAGTVERLVLDGGHPTPVASGQVIPIAIALAQGNLYWGISGGFGSSAFPQDGGPGAVVALAPDGGSPETLVTVSVYPAFGFGIAAGGASIAYTSPGDDTVMIVPIDGGSPLTLATHQEVLTGIAIDDTNVYWTDPGHDAVMEIARGGGTPVTLASGQTLAYEVAVSGGHVYWTVTAGGDPGAGSVMTLEPSCACE